MRIQAWIVAGLMAVGFASSADAQLRWDLFEDAISDSACDVVNTLNSELVVLSDTGQLMLVSNLDTILTDSFVDLDSLVFVNGEPAGSIEFAEDGDGFRTLWWLTFDGRVIDLDSLTLEPLVSDAFPTDFVSTPCDSCEFGLVDNPPIGVCPTLGGGGIPLELCGLGVGGNLFMAMTMCGFVALRSTRRR